MAAITVNSIVTEVQAAFPDATATQIISHMNKVDRYLASKIRLRASTITVNLTSAYALSDTIVRIYSVRYVRSSSASNSFMLKAEDMSGLDIKYPNWRSWPNSEPRFYSFDVDSAGAFSLLLAPTPNTTTSGGYPVVYVYASLGGTLSAGGDIPNKIMQSDVYKFGACYYFAMETRREEAGFWKNLYDQALQHEINLEMGRSTQKGPEVYIPFPSGGVA
jgi:hypothetical protein